MSGQYPHCIRLTSIKKLPVVSWGIANAELELFLLSWAGTTTLGNPFVPVVRLSCPPHQSVVRRKEEKPSVSTLEAEKSTTQGQQ